ncbi:hypothetical protein [Streptomyces sp. NBC_01803]|uniref:hypothetical protein n=1 Tax=Streptomyces sp. NBC_01803 TaxID=2975946 RepID=UPI002DD8841C|nr:hypothetical protein [Streptomyces sp. NBC_01803]WSA44225.1 hypothetical protein OIE51_08400 [Streptomyces sp. NBC_01803]
MRHHVRDPSPSGRVSIYLARNGARFIAAPIHPDEEFRAALEQLQEALGFTEVHLTGGEPTLHPNWRSLSRWRATAATG